MKPFKTFIIEQEDVVKYTNPGGDWLKHERKRAIENDRRGATTASVSNVALPVSHIKDFRGANGEEKFRNDLNEPKAKKLEATIGHPSNFNSKDNAIHIAVDHNGDPRVTEGNHRLAYAARHNISHIHASISYHIGGETSPGPLHPDTLNKIVKRDA